MQELLLLCNRPVRGSNADTIIEHLDALHEMPGWRVREVSMLGDLPSLLDLNRFDAIGLHYTLHISDPNNHWLSQRAMDRIAAFDGPKCIWMHDEYRRVNDTAAKLRHMGINTIFTVVPEGVAKVIYAPERVGNAAVYSILTGYVSPALENIEAPAFTDRSIDIGYRARRPPFWLGRLGQEKIEIGLQSKPLAEAYGLLSDISVEEADRIYGAQWIAFLKNSKSTLCVESGSSIVDFTGDVEKTVEAAVRKNPDMRFVEVEPLMEGVDGVLMINCISPRIFEMAACRTLIIAHPGDYSGIIIPWVHYVPLEKDLSNFAQVVETLTDGKRCEKILTSAYNDLIGSRAYTYKSMSNFCAARIPRPTQSKSTMSAARWFLQRHLSSSFLMHNYLARTFQKTILSSGMRKLLIRFWLKLPPGLQASIRPMMKVLGR